MLDIAEISSPVNIDVVRTLFTEYKQSVGVDLWFGRAFEKELNDLPRPYVRPGGRLLLFREDGKIAGCGALRRAAPGVAEVKRMWLRPAFRGKGNGRAMANALVDAAREEGYRAVRLEVLSVMPQARKLYESMGFKPIPHTAERPFPGSALMERLL